MATRQAKKERLHAERVAREKASAAAEARRRRQVLLVGGLLTVAAIAAAVVALTAGGGEAGGQAAAGDEILDVHGLGLNPADGALYLATHTGLFRASKGETKFHRVDAPEQDLMGFSVAAPNRFLASGHPGPSQDLPNPLGLIESRDRGRTWRNVSLLGEADFHVLRSRGAQVYGFDGRLMVSRDGGESWTERTPPGPIADLGIDPGDPRHVVASTETGFQGSQDEGKTWRSLGRRAVALLAWHTARRLYAVDGEGRVSMSADRGKRWTEMGTVQGPPAAFAVDGDGAVYVARPDGLVDWSADGGATWQPRIVS